MGFLGLSIQQLAALIVLALVGTAAVVYYVNTNPPSSSFVKEEFECKVNYDFSKFNLPADVKADWNACYTEEPRSAKREWGAVECLDTAKESCSVCSEALAMKYNDSTYCEIKSTCGHSDEIDGCKRFMQIKKHQRALPAKIINGLVADVVFKRVRKVYSKWDSCIHDGDC